MEVCETEAARRVGAPRPTCSPQTRGPGRGAPASELSEEEEVWAPHWCQTQASHTIRTRQEGYRLKKVKTRTTRTRTRVRSRTNLRTDSSRRSPKIGPEGGPIGSRLGGKKQQSISPAGFKISTILILFATLAIQAAVWGQLVRQTQAQVSADQGEWLVTEQSKGD